MRYSIRLNPRKIPSLYIVLSRVQRVRVTRFKKKGGEEKRKKKNV